VLSTREIFVTHRRSASALRLPFSLKAMPARSIGTATISFGLVSVPVNIYSSSESKASVSFNMLHKKCGTRLKQQYICPKDNNEVVTREETVKGYEFAKDQYVILTPEELKALEEKATSTIDVVEFVPLSGVDREYLEKVYYLGPDKGGDRAYRLLAAALKETGRAALGQYAARGQQHLVLLRPLNGVLVMEQLHYADEVRPTTEVTIPPGDVKDAELKLAKQLIDQTSNESFEPNKYKDTVRERVLETIQRKVDGQDITADVTPGTDTKMLDLMQALKASLAGEKPKKEKGEAKRKAS
jgi:DNA end-binding protein Ku